MEKKKRITHKSKYIANMRTERRMDKNHKPGKKNVLTVDPALLDEKNFVYRFVNETPGNVESREAIDYDVARIGATVGDEKAGEGQPDGSVVRKNIGNGETAILMCKRRDWYEEDQRKKEEALLENQAVMNDPEYQREEFKKQLLKE